MNELDLNKISDNTQILTEEINEEIEQPLKKSFKDLLSLLGDGDSENEDDNNNRENIKPLSEENENDNLLNYRAENVESNITKKLKPLSRKDKLKLASDTQRLIRENENIEFSYKPKQCKKFNHLKEMLAEIATTKNNRNNNRPVTVLNNQAAKTIEERSKETNKENNDTQTDMKETNNLESENDIAPLRNRIAMNDNTKKLLDKSALNKTQVQKSLDTIMREKYKNRNCLIQLKSGDQYKEEKKSAEALLRKLKENLKPIKKTTQEIDLVFKERGGIHHHIHISDTMKCVKLAGEIDPLLSKGINLSEEEERKWMGMSKKDKWKKHRSLLLAAESEKRKAARDERIKEMNLRDEEKKKEANVGEVKGNNGLSDDDYEWNEENASDTDSHSDTCDDDDDDDNGEDCETDRGEISNNEESDDDFGRRNDKLRSKKRIIGSDDEEQMENTNNFDNETLLTFDRKSPPIVVDEELNFFDIPTSNSNCDDLFSDSLVYNITTSSDQSKSRNSSFITLSSEQHENNSDKSFYSTFSINKSFNDTQPLHKSLNDTDIIDRSANTCIMGNTLDDTVILEKTLDDTVMLEKTLEDTVVLDKTSDLNEVVKNISTSTVNKELLNPEAGSREHFVGSVEMRSEHRKLFDFTCSTEASSENPTQPSVKQTFSKLKELFKEDSDDNIDIDDVHLTDDEDDEEDDDNSVDLDRIVSRKIKVSKVGLSDEEKEEEEEEDENITDVSSDSNDSTDVSGSENENNGNEDYEDAEDDEEEILRKQVVGIKTKAAKEFFDDEAELSGSDVEQFGPDENESDLDRYEEEEGDAEKLPSEGRLRRQIEKIHNRIEIDNDARDIRYLKELYLEDGDLHLGGEGPRKKRFTWAGINDNVEDNSQYGVNAGEEGEDDDDGGNENDFTTMVLDQSFDKTDEKEEEDKNVIPLIKKYGKHLEKCKWVPKNVDSQSEICQAWQIADITKVAINQSEQVSMISKNNVVKKYGSFMSRANLVPPPPVALNPSSSSKLSLKSRMQQHTFTVESKSTNQQKNTYKRQSNAGNLDESDNLRITDNKRQKN